MAAWFLLLLELVINNYPHMIQICFKTLPLLIFTMGIIKQSWRSHIWLCFLLLWYFLANINNLFLQKNLVLDSIELALIVILFVSAMFYCRWAKDLGHQQQHTEHTEEL